MGLGLLGRGAGDARFLAECGAELIVTDMKSEEELASSVEPLRVFSNVTLRLGGHRMEDFEGRDMIIKAAGVPLDSPSIAHARERGVPIEMSTALFTALSGATIVGVTGTRGKSSVTHLLYEILHYASTGAEKKVWLGGNVRGVSTLALLPEVRSGDVAVLELDSWQLQGFGERHLSPHVAVFTNLMDDHLNYYKGDRARYLADKQNIFAWQKEGDHVVMGAEIAGELADETCRVPSELHIVDGTKLPDEWTTLMKGEHAMRNILLAVEAARALGVSDDTIREVVASFVGVPGRLECIAKQDGVQYYNDTTATTPDATIAALRAVGEGRSIVLIMGGADKGLDMTKLVAELPHHARAIILLPGTGTDKLALGSFDGEVVHVGSMREAVETARATARAGDTVLLSPGLASFGLFNNEFDRGDQFNAAVQSIEV